MQQITYLLKFTPRICNEYLRLNGMLLCKFQIGRGQYFPVTDELVQLVGDVSVLTIWNISDFCADVCIISIPQLLTFAECILISSQN